MIKRATEEISMLRNDIFHTMKYYDDVQNAVCYICRLSRIVSVEEQLV